MDSMCSFFDVNGTQLGDVFPMNVPEPTAASTVSTGQAWANVFGQVAAGALDVFKQREARKLEQTYLNKNQIPPASMLAPGMQASTFATPTNPWPLIAIGGALLLIMSRK